MTQDFAKILRADDGRQVLVYIEYATDHERDDYYDLHQIVSTKLAMIDVKISGPETAMRKIFDDYTDENATNLTSLDVVRRMDQAGAH